MSERFTEYSFASPEFRVAVEVAKREWLSARRSLYLLKDVGVPLSVDRRVWPVDEAHRGVEIQVSAVERDPQRLGHLLGEPNVVPLAIGPNWLRIGFDVCDTTLLSGLMNCGYSEDSRTKLSKQWCSALNDWHLFDDLSDARRFAVVTGKRVPEHAPFLVFGLYAKGPLLPIRG